MTTDAAITLNGRRYGRGRASVVASLFTPGGTLDGHYTVTRGGGAITLHDCAGVRVGGISRHGVLHRSSLLNGRWWHSYGQPDGIPEYASYSQRVDECAAALRIARETQA